MDVHANPTQTELNFQNLRDQVSVRLINRLSVPSSQTKRIRKNAKRSKKMTKQIRKAKPQIANTADAAESDPQEELADFAEVRQSNHPNNLSSHAPQ